MAGYNFSQNIIGLNKTNGDIHELEVEVANLSASILSIGGDVDTLESKSTQNCYRRFYAFGVGEHSITNIDQGDIIIFARNGIGVAVITDNSSISWIIASDLLSDVSYSYETKTVTFTRDSQYSGSVIVISSLQDLP